MKKLEEFKRKTELASGTLTAAITSVYRDHYSEPELTAERYPDVASTKPANTDRQMMLIMKMKETILRNTSEITGHPAGQRHQFSASAMAGDSLIRSRPGGTVLLSLRKIWVSRREQKFDRRGKRCLTAGG